MAATSKTQLLNDAYTALRKRYKPGPAPERLSVLEAVILGLCHEGTTREQANQALSRFKDDFFDWNEVRVSSIEEIQAALAGVPDAEERAHRLRRFLRQVFEKTYGFDLEAHTKKPLKEAIKALQEYEAFASDYVTATVVLRSLAGHAIPIDGPARRVYERLGVAGADTDLHALRATIERAIPKNRGPEFVTLIEELAHDVCVEGTPDCPECDLRKMCPTGHARLAEIKRASKPPPKVKAKPAAAPAPAPVPAPAASKAVAKGKAPRSK